MSLKTPHGQGEGPLLIGIDAGTSVVKAVVIDLEGHEVAAAKQRLGFQVPRASWAEVDMNAVWAATVHALRGISADRLLMERVAALGVTATASGGWLVDEHYRPVRPAILWNDGRAAELIKQWWDTGVMDEIFRLSGNVVYPGYGVAVLRWIKENEPETLASARHYLFAKDWIRYRLTDQVATEDSDASFLPFDITGRRYSSRIFQLCGIENLADIFPPIVASHAVVGTVTRHAAEETGLPAGIPVVAGLNDVTAATLGAGAVAPGQACSILGTSNLNSVVTDRPVFEPHGVGGGQSTVDGRWIRSLVNTSGTLNVDWAARMFYGLEEGASGQEAASAYARMEADASSAPLGSNALIYHPYLNSTGVVSPFVHPAARATLFGLSFNHDRRHVVRAVFEGATMAIHDCYRHLDLPVDEVILSGGGARNRFWSQMIADATGKTIVVPEGEEFGSRGACIVAAVGVGLFGSAGEAVQRMVRMRRRHEPDPGRHLLYQEVYGLYQDLYGQMPELWWKRHQLQAFLEAQETSV